MLQLVLKECLPIIPGCPMIGPNDGRVADYIVPGAQGESADQSYLSTTTVGDLHSRLPRRVLVHRKPSARGVLALTPAV
jgi:hypothetical protein